MTSIDKKVLEIVSSDGGHNNGFTVSDVSYFFFNLHDEDLDLHTVQNALIKLEKLDYVKATPNGKGVICWSRTSKPVMRIES